MADARALLAALVEAVGKAQGRPPTGATNSPNPWAAVGAAMQKALAFLAQPATPVGALDRMDSERVREAAYMPPWDPAPDVVQQILEAAYPTDGTTGPHAWTAERIRQRERFAESVIRILAAASEPAAGGEP